MLDSQIVGYVLQTPAKKICEKQQVRQQLQGHQHDRNANSYRKHSNSRDATLSKTQRDEF